MGKCTICGKVVNDDSGLNQHGVCWECIVKVNKAKYKANRTLPMLQSENESPRISVVLYIIGVVTILAGLVLGVVMGNTFTIPAKSYFGDPSFNYGLFFAGLFGGVTAGAFYVALGKIIALLKTLVEVTRSQGLTNNTSKE